MTGNAVELGAVDACPDAATCENCGATDELDIATALTPVGVYCLTLCRGCAETGTVPEPGDWSTAARRVLDHCCHLGIDTDQMAAALDQEP